MKQFAERTLAFTATTHPPSRNFGFATKHHLNWFLNSRIQNYEYPLHKGGYSLERFKTGLKTHLFREAYA